MPRRRRKELKEETIKTADADSSNFSQTVQNCPNCSYCSIDAQELRQHLKSHEDFQPVSVTLITTKPKLHHCPKCKFTTVLRSKLNAHLIEHDIKEAEPPTPPDHDIDEGEVTSQSDVQQIALEKEETFLCFDCGFMANDAGTFQDHRKWHEVDEPAAQIPASVAPKFNCDKCKFIADTPGDLLDHMALSHPSKPTFYCPEHDCDFETENPDDLPKHRKKHKRAESSTNLCPVCGLIVEDETKFSRHVKAHKNTKSYKCTQCDYTAFRRSELTKHKRTHPQKCSLCFYIAKSKTGLWNHRNTKHRAEKDRICTQCDQIFVTAALRRHHQETDHDRISQDYRCEACDFYSLSKSGLARHLKSSHDDVKTSYKCSHCNWETKLKYRLINHEKTHTEQRPLICDQCGSSFKIKGSLTRHIKLHHTHGRGCFSCPRCTSTFKTNSAMVKHVQFVHSGIPCTSALVHEKRNHHKCPQCEYKTARRWNLKTHMRIHTGTKPFICTHCNHAFSDKSNLHTHLKAHKLNISDKL